VLEGALTSFQRRSVMFDHRQRHGSLLKYVQSDSNISTIIEKLLVFDSRIAVLHLRRLYGSKIVEFPRGSSV
jgi:hypothetical protein